MMKNILFILWGLWHFRVCRSGKGVGLVVTRFLPDDTGRKVLDRAAQLMRQGEKVWVLCAFNEAPAGVQLPDYRQVYIFNNDPERLARFCAEKGIGRLEYAADCAVMRGAAARFGLQVTEI